MKRDRGWKPGKHEHTVIPKSRIRAVLAGEKLRGAHIYTTREVAVIMRHSLVWVQRMIRGGQIKAVRLGGQYFVNENEIRRLKGVKGRPRRDKRGAIQATKAVFPPKGDVQVP